MSAVNSLQPPSSPLGAEQRAEQRPYEPSMEEILASIRRIIADDQPLPPVREPEVRGAAAVPESEPAANSGASAPSEPDRAPEADAPPRAGSSSVILSESAPAAAHRHVHIDAPQFPEMPAGTVAPPPSDESDAADIAALDFAEEADLGVPPTPMVHDHADVAPPVDRVEPYPAREVHRDADALHRDPPPEALFSKATDHSVTAAFNALAATRLADNSEELLGIARDMIRPLLKAWIDDNMPSMVERMVRAEIERVARGGR